MRTPGRLSAALLVAVAAVATLAGCSSAGRGATAAAAHAAIPKSTVVPAFPTTVAAPNGSVTIKRQPNRIVSLDPTATEDLFAIGAGSQVVAVDQDSDYPPGVPVTSLSGLTPNIEAIAKYNPSLVIASQNSRGLVSGLGELVIARQNPGGLGSGLPKRGTRAALDPRVSTPARAYHHSGATGRATGQHYD